MTGLVSGLAAGMVIGILLGPLDGRNSSGDDLLSASHENVDASQAKDRPDTKGVGSKKASMNVDRDYESQGEEKPDTSIAYPEGTTDSLDMKGSGFSEGDDIVIAQDRLLFRTLIHVSNDSLFAGDATMNIDSLLIDDWNKYPANEAYRVEFWASPINYRGYKLQKDKLILFGIEHFEDVSLWRINQKLYLRYHDKYYLLQESIDFRQLQGIKLPNVE